MGSHCPIGMCLCLQGYNFYTCSGPWYTTSVKSLRSVLSDALSLMSLLIIPAPMENKYLHSTVASGDFQAVGAHLTRACVVNQNRQVLVKGVLTSARIGGNKRFLGERKPWEAKGKRTLLESRHFIHCPTNCTKREGLPLQNVIRIQSGIHSW